MSRGALGALAALVLCGAAGHAQDLPATNDYYAPYPTKYDKGYGPESAEDLEVFRGRLAYIRFNLGDVYRSNTDPEYLRVMATLYAKSTNQVATLISTNAIRTVVWTNAMRRAQMEVLGYERGRARKEEEIYRAWIEYKKPNPLSFIPNVTVRQDFLAATNRLTAKDWDEIRRIVSETDRRRELLRIDLEKMGREITEAEISAFAPAKPKTAPPPPLSLPKPD